MGKGKNQRISRKSSKGKRTIDKWKLKKWYSVISPPVFEEKEIAEILSADESNLKNRILRIGLTDIMRSTSPNSFFTYLKFRITHIKGKNAYTKLIGHELAQSYIKTLVRRRRTAIHVVEDVKTKDGKNLRIKLVIITGVKVGTPIKAGVRKFVIDEVKKISSEQTYDKLMQEIIFGKLSIMLFTRLKKVAPMKRVEVRKTELKEELEVA